MLQEAILVGKNEWQDMKADWQRMKESTGEERGVLNHKTPNVEGKTDEQANNQGMKVKEAKNGGSTKNSKTWAQVISKHANTEKEKEASNQGDIK